MTEEEFKDKLKLLEQFLAEHHLQICGCGCCGSPWIEGSAPGDQNHAVWPLE